MSRQVETINASYLSLYDECKTKTFLARKGVKDASKEKALIVHETQFQNLIKGFSEFDLQKVKKREKSFLINNEDYVMPFQYRNKEEKLLCYSQPDFIEAIVVGEIYKVFPLQVAFPKHGKKLQNTISALAVEQSIGRIGKLFAKRSIYPIEPADFHKLIYKGKEYSYNINEFKNEAIKRAKEIKGWHEYNRPVKCGDEPCSSCGIPEKFKKLYCN